MGGEREREWEVREIRKEGGRQKEERKGGRRRVGYGEGSERFDVIMERKDKV